MPIGRRAGTLVLWTQQGLPPPRPSRALPSTQTFLSEVVWMLAYLPSPEPRDQAQTVWSFEGQWRRQEGAALGIGGLATGGWLNGGSQLGPAFRAVIGILLGFSWGGLCLLLA